MALTAAKVKDLEDNGFPDLFEEHQELWEAKAREAYAYAKKLVEPTGEPVRPDDVLELLVPALVLAEEFRDFLEDNRLRQKYWRSYFGEFVLDKLWEDLESEEAEEGTG
jgi:hypothetical protein